MRKSNPIDINECLTNNGGCNDQATCTNTDGSFDCKCNSGYSGDGFICNGISSFYFSFYFFYSNSTRMKTKKIFLDINECSINNGGCHSQAICTNIIGSFTCACKLGYQGNGFNCTGIFSFLWLLLIINLISCPAIKCPSTSIGNANYSITLAGNTALGKCDDLYYGSPILYCDLTGHWNQTITGNPCSSNSLDFLSKKINK